MYLVTQWKVGPTLVVFDYIDTVSDCFIKIRGLRYLGIRVNCDETI